MDFRRHRRRYGFDSGKTSRGPKLAEGQKKKLPKLCRLNYHGKRWQVEVGRQPKVEGGKAECPRCESLVKKE
jgi:hypothetical protein